MEGIVSEGIDNEKISKIVFVFMVVVSVRIVKLFLYKINIT